MQCNICMNKALFICMQNKVLFCNDADESLTQVFLIDMFKWTVQIDSLKNGSLLDSSTQIN